MSGSLSYNFEKKKILFSRNDCLDNVFSFFFFLMTLNSLFPMDKVLSFLIFPVLLFTKKFYTFEVKYFVFFLLPFVSFILNVGGSHLKLFIFPIFVFSALLLYHSHLVNLKQIVNGLLMSVVCGLVFCLLANVGITNDFAFSLWEKGLPYYGPVGFSPTQQVFGTLCIIIIIINEEKSKYGLAFFIAIISLILTLNRCSILFFSIVLFVYHKKIFFPLCFIAIFLVMYFWRDIEMIMFNTDTLNSREELRYGVELSFWKQGDFLTYMIGKGAIEVTKSIADKTIWGRMNIENGIDFLLHGYGFVGIIFYSLVSLYLVCKLIFKGCSRLVFFVLYYLFIEQWFTQEYVASSFMFFILTILLLSDFISKGKIFKSQVKWIQCHSSL